MELHLAQLKRLRPGPVLDLAEWDAFCTLQSDFAVVPDPRPFPYTSGAAALHHKRSRPRAVLRSDKMVVMLRWNERKNEEESVSSIEVSYSDGYKELAVQIVETMSNELNCIVSFAPCDLVRVEELILGLDGYAAILHTNDDVKLCKICLTTWEDSGRVYAFLIDPTRMQLLEGLCVWAADEVITIERSSIRLVDVTEARSGIRPANLS